MPPQYMILNGEIIRRDLRTMLRVVKWRRIICGNVSGIVKVGKFMRRTWGL